MRRWRHQRRFVYCRGISAQPNIRLNDTALKSLQGLSADARAVARAMALFWTWRGRSPVYELLRHLGAKSASRRDFTHENVRVAQRELSRAGLLVEQDGRPGFSQLKDELRVALYRELLDATPIGALREALHTGEPYDAKPAYARRPLWDIAAAVALVRLELLGEARPPSWPR